MLIDLHVHTTVGSRDSGLTVDRLLATAKDRGLAGVAITDHNCQWDLGDWPERARRAGLVLCQGLEAGCQEGHFLVFGLPGEVTVDDLRRLAGVTEGWPSIAALAPAVQRLGAVVVAAHPRLTCYGGGGYNTPDRDRIVAVEVLNGSNEGELHEFVAARALAESHGLPMTGGSDAHGAGGVGKYVTCFEEPLSDGANLVAALTRGCYRPAALAPGAETPTEFRFQMLSLLWAFDVDRGWWERIGPGGKSPGPRAGADLFYDAEGDAFFLVGGHDAGFSYDHPILRLDFRSLDWWPIEPQGEGPSCDKRTAWAFSSKRRAIFALTHSEGQFVTLHEFPLSGKEWRCRRLSGDVPSARPYTKIAFLTSGQLALVPGKALYGERTEIRQWYTLDLREGRWQKHPLPSDWQEHRWDGGCEASESGVLFAGGFRYFCESSETWMLRADGVSARLSDVPAALACRGASLTNCSGRLLLLGGRDSSNRFSTDPWCWDARASTWRPVPTKGEGPAARAYHASCWDPKRRRLWVLGGLGTVEEQGCEVLL